MIYDSVLLYSINLSYHKKQNKKMNSTATTIDVSTMFGKMFKELNKISQANAHQASIIKSLNEQLKQFQMIINGGENTNNNHKKINPVDAPIKVSEDVYFTPQFAQYLEGNTTEIVFGNIVSDDNILIQDIKVQPIADEKQIDSAAEKQIDSSADKQIDSAAEKQIEIVVEKQIDSAAEKQIEIVDEVEQFIEETEKTEFYDDFKTVKKQQKKSYEKKSVSKKVEKKHNNGLSALIGDCKKMKLGRTQEVIPICRTIGFSPEQLLVSISVLAERLSLFTVVPDAQNDINPDNTAKAIFALQYMSGLINIELADKLMLQSFEDCAEINLSLKQMLHQLYLVNDLRKLIIGEFIENPNDLINRFQSQILLPLGIIREDEITDYNLSSNTYARYSSLL